MDNNNKGGRRSGDHGDRHRHEPLRLRDLVNTSSPPSSSQVYGHRYDQTSTSEQPVPPGHYYQAGYGEAVYPSQGVQTPRPPPDPYQNEQQSGPQYANEYTMSPQQQYPELKRMRESSGSSDREHRPQPKHVRYQHASDAGRRQDSQPGAESSEHGSGRLQEQSVPVSLPGIDTMYPENDFFGDNPQPRAESSAHGAGRSQEQGVPASSPGVQSLPPEGAFRGQPGPRSQGGFTIDNITWRGYIFDVDETRHTYWTEHQVHQLAVILASFASWEEVGRLGQLLPGRRTWKATTQKLYNTPTIWRRWTAEEDRQLVSMGAPPENGVDEAGERFCFEQTRSRAEVYGRRRMFARGTGLIMWKNLGNTPLLQKLRD